MTEDRPPLQQLVNEYRLIEEELESKRSAPPSPQTEKLEEVLKSLETEIRDRMRQRPASDDLGDPALKPVADRVAAKFAEGAQKGRDEEEGRSGYTF